MFAKLWWSLISALVVSEAMATGAIAQIAPDTTLGTRSSTITPDGINRLLINGGATRGGNLFHSFVEFNIGNGQQVYFTNPTSIENIISRVTGKNLSNIDGTLGVLGNANLFLINPNGIVFGPNARLDIRGSFFASTADHLVFQDGSVFSATHPETTPLLTISTPLGINQWLPTSGTVTNTGNLTVTGDLTLAAKNLDLQGQLIAGENISLLASDTLNIHDSSTNAFIAWAGKNLLIQGNQSININALSHPNSGLVSAGNLVLKSDNAIVGDAHFSAGQNFSVERLDGSLGSLISPHDPVFEVAGDFSLDSYTGASLQILAGGSVTIPGDVVIVAPGEPFNDGTVILSDGTSLAISGTTQPTLDIRAGMTGNSEITIGNIINPGGLVFLSNQFQSNPNLAGNISVGSIITASELGGGTVIIDSRGGTTVGFLDASGGDSATGNFTGNGGNVTFLANGDIFLPFPSTILSNGLAGGTIKMQSDTAIIQEDAPFGTDPFTLSTISSLTLFGTGGNVSLTAPTISLGGNIYSILIGTGQGGDLKIAANTLSANQATLATQTLGEGDSGNIQVDAKTIALDFSLIATITLSPVSGNAGNVEITTNTLSATRGAQIGSLITSQPGQPTLGNAGNVTITATDSISLSGFQPTNLPFVTQYAPSSIFSSSAVESQGNSGNIAIKTGTLSLTDGAAIGTNLIGIGNAGQIQIEAGQSIVIDGAVFVDFDGISEESDTHPSGITSEVFTGAIGQGGDITIITPILQVTNGGTITASTNGQGDAGNINITASQFASFDGLTSFASMGLSDRRQGAGVSAGENTTGQAGILTITTPSLAVTNGSQITAETRGIGKGGDLIFQVSNSLLLQGNNSGLFANTTPLATGDGGSIFINSPKIMIRDNAQIAVDSQGAGIGGNITVQANTLQLDNQALITAETASNTGGNITLQANEILVLRNNSRISTTAGTAGAGGDGGNIIINTPFLVAQPIENSDITANAFTGSGGKVEITAEGIFGLRILSRDQLATELGTSDPNQLDPIFLPTSDITAISQVNPNLNGEVIVRSPDQQSDLTNVTLPSEVVDASRLIARDCSARGEIARRRGSLVVTGRGGLPANPSEQLRGESLLIGWESLDRPSSTSKTPSTLEPSPQLVEVQSLIKRPDGTIILAAQTPANVNQDWNRSASCNSSNP